MVVTEVAGHLRWDRRLFGVAYLLKLTVLVVGLGVSWGSMSLVRWLSWERRAK